jgi:hypothetical protein
MQQIKEMQYQSYFNNGFSAIINILQLPQTFYNNDHKDMVSAPFMLNTTAAVCIAVQTIG